MMSRNSWLCEFFLRRNYFIGLPPVLSLSNVSIFLFLIWSFYIFLSLDLYSSTKYQKKNFFTPAHAKDKIYHWFCRASRQRFFYENTFLQESFDNVTFKIFFTFSHLLSWNQLIKWSVRIKANINHLFNALKWFSTLKLSCDSRFQRAFTACSCVFKVIPWFESTNVISLKTQPHAVDACVKRSSQRSLTLVMHPNQRVVHVSLAIHGGYVANKTLNHE